MKTGKWFGMSKREYQKRKRKQFKELRRAFEKPYDALLCGSYYLPTEARNAIVGLRKNMQLLEDTCKPWWRKA